ncbi:hemerythrin domain-containing protein [Dactylosporangium sp. NPDC050688]|uniref:hemerythrin domain-containing protein n=1 Tax=Dactylosporangium sp. NPDC050688 TaxID=3157217 RepID=UPI0033E2FB26
MATHDRAVALSAQLAQAHDDLRHQLRDLRAGRARDLPTHCLAFCAALTAHHQGEDTGMFAELLRLRPDLSGTIAKLVEDHGMIAWILSRVAELASSPDPSPAINSELDGLAAIMESHFAFEERAISAALDGGTPDTGWSAMVFRFRDQIS